MSRSAVLPGLQPNGPLPQAPPGRISSLFLPIIFCLIFAAGCAHRTYQTQAPASVPQPGASVEPAPSVPSEAAPANRYVEQGVASWYGPLFNGRRTSDGEIYNMHDFTAAHRTLPFNSVVRVTNLSNGMQTEVRINDRGPFVANRVIDLSLSAARAIGMVGPGTAPVRLDVVSGPDPQSGFFAVQVGSFRAEENAEHLRRQLAGRYSPAVTVPLNLPTGRFYRVRVGRFASESAARALAEQLHATEQLIAFVVRLDN